MWGWKRRARAESSLRLCRVVQFLQERVRVVRRVVVHNLLWVQHVDLVDVVMELGADLALHLLDLLKATRLHEGASSVQVIRQDLGKLLHDVLQDVGWCLQKRLQRRQVGALLDDALQRPLGLCLQVFAGVLVQVDCQEAAQNICFGQCPRVIWRVAANLTEGPRRSRFQVVLWFVDEGILKWWDALGDHDSQGKSLGEGSNVPKGHDARQAVVAPGLRDVVHHGSHTAGIHNEFCQVGCVPCNLADACGSVLADELVNVLETMQDLREDLCLDDDLCQVHRVLCDLRKGRAHLPLQGCVGVGDVLGEKRDCSSVHDRLRQLWRMLADVAQCRSGDPLERQLRLLEAEHEQWHRPSINDQLGQLLCVPRDVA
mmetsp:Transcript_23810/g.64856  ORF Transcript_23810/g.64856 Transcript_23810/m.64856 type:complete len:372 (+) Transcript_23810:86-1201(+)